MKATQKSPGIRGWKWATGRKPNRSMKFLWAPGDIRPLHDADLATKKFDAPEWYGSNGWCGYICRVPKKKRRAKS